MTTVTTAIPTALTPEGAQAVFRATLDALARPGTVRRLPAAADEPLAGFVPAALLPLLALADLSTPACVVGDDAGLDNGTDLDNSTDLDSGTGAQTRWDEIVRVATNAPRTALADARLAAALRPLTADELAGLRTGTAAAPEDGALACLAVAGIATVHGAVWSAAADRPDAETIADGADGSPVAHHTDGNANTDEADGSPVAHHTDGNANTDEADGSPVAHHTDGNANTDEADGSPGSGSQTGRLLLRLSGPGVPGERAVIVTGLPAGFAAARSRLVAGFPAGSDLLLVAPDGAMTGLPRTTTVHEEAV